METFTLQSEAELADVVEAVVEKLREGEYERSAFVLALHGDLGSGKTTFMQHLARRLGITDYVTSPTFVVMKRYSLPEEQSEALPFTNLYHLDAYRIESDDEMRPLHFAELLTDGEAIVAIEWAEHIEALLPAHATHLHFVTQGDKRIVTLNSPA